MMIFSKFKVKVMRLTLKVDKEKSKLRFNVNTNKLYIIYILDLFKRKWINNVIRKIDSMWFKQFLKSENLELSNYFWWFNW